MINNIFVVGPPASGKTTFILLLTDKLIDNKINFRSINDLNVLFDLCQKNIKSEKYYYDDFGTLHLRSEYRAEVMDMQYRKLSQLWKIKFDGVSILEITNPDLEVIVQKYFGKMFNSVLIVIDSMLDNLLLRNSLREPKFRIPNDYVCLFGPNSKQSCLKSRKYFSKMEVIENNLSVIEYHNRCENLIAKFMI